MKSTASKQNRHNAYAQRKRDKAAARRRDYVRRENVKRNRGGRGQRSLVPAMQARNIVDFLSALQSLRSAAERRTERRAA